MPQNIEKEYARLKKKHPKLPEFSWIHNNFVIKEEEDSVPPMEAIRHAVADKLNFAARNLLEPIIASSENYCCYFERRMLGEGERDKLFEIYKKVMSLLWTSSRVALDMEEKEWANWLIKVKNEWESLRKPLAEMCTKLSIGWEKYEKPSRETVYHG